MKEKEEELNEKLVFLEGFENTFKDRIHTDILVKPGTGGPPIPAHRALLVCLLFFISLFLKSIFVFIILAKITMFL